MKQRTIVCPPIENDGAYLLCKMPSDRARAGEFEAYDLNAATRITLAAKGLIKG